MIVVTNVLTDWGAALHRARWQADVGVSKLGAARVVPVLFVGATGSHSSL